MQYLTYIIIYHLAMWPMGLLLIKLLFPRFDWYIEISTHWGLIYYREKNRSSNHKKLRLEGRGVNKVNTLLWSQRQKIYPYLKHLHTVVYFFITRKINNVTLPSIVQNGARCIFIEYSDEVNTARSALSSF